MEKWLHAAVAGEGADSGEGREGQGQPAAEGGRDAEQ